MSAPKHSPRLLELCASVQNKRPKTVIDHILKHGQVTTEELTKLYGYEHAPRAARDVREAGIPLVTFKVSSSSGRQIAAYKFGQPESGSLKKSKGRTALSSKIKTALIEKYGCRCFIYSERMPESLLQIDHRVPFEIGGESRSMNPKDFMLLCGSANRAKSWSCEHCENFTDKKNTKICLSCYWASPENYSHVAMKEIRRLDLVWESAEIENFERLKADAAVVKQPLPEFVKETLRKALGKTPC